MHRRALLTSASLALAAPAIVRAQGQNRVALVIGNSRYRFESSLPNPKRDSADVAARFKAYGMQTELVEDADRAKMQQAIAQLGERAKGADLAAFYYAGHGLYWENGVYLLPVDGDLSTTGNVRNFIGIPPVRKALNNAAHRMMIFDNCLNNPADGWRQTATEDKARGTVTQGQEPANGLYMYSSVPGRVAPDGPPGQNSPFGAAFLRLFDGSDVDLRALTARLNREVIIATAGRQICAYRNAYAEPYILKTSPPARFPPPANPLAADPSRVVELPNAIALAREKKLPMPLSLIGIRPLPGRPHANKVGAYRYDFEGLPNILVIYNVEDPKAAEVMLLYHRNGTYNWTWVRGTLVNDRLDVRPFSGGSNHVFTWNDGNGGSLSVFPRADTNTGKIVQSRFTRLDG
jgi:hypothetical protein